MGCRYIIAPERISDLSFPTYHLLLIKMSNAAIVSAANDKKPESTEVTSIIEKSEKHYYDDGDIVIISSDGVHFKIPSYHLQAASYVALEPGLTLLTSLHRKVFRGMKEFCNKDDLAPIELSDNTDETSLILDHVFDMVNQQVDVNELPDDCIWAIIRFLKKYEFNRELKICALQLHANLLHKKSSWGVFLRAAYLEDHDLCGLAIEREGVWKWSLDVAPEHFGQRVASGNVFDLRTTPIEEFGKIPTDCMWALLRASAKLPSQEIAKCVRSGMKEMATEYVRLIKLRGESCRMIRNCG